MKKITSYILSIILVGLLVFVPTTTVKAAGISLSASATSVKIGDTINFTLTMPDDYFGTCVISVSDSNILSGSYDARVSLGKAAGYSGTYSFSLSAKAAGSATVTVTCIDASDSVENPADLGSSSVTVTVANESSGGGNSGNNDSGQSADNFLAGITLSAGTLSPRFVYTTTSYTATVPYSVTNITVSASLSSSKATIESVTGGQNLQVGENTIKIVVKAENGVTRTYTIVVTRKAENDTSEPDEPDDPADDNPIESAGDADSFNIHGTTYSTAEIIPEAIVPQDFEMSEISLGGKIYPCLEFMNGSLTLLLLEADEEGQLYVYDREDQSVYPFVSLTSETGYVIVLLPKVEEIPADYNEVTLTIEGKGMITAYQIPESDETDAYTPEEGDSTEAGDVGFFEWFLPETVYADEVNASDFYLIYCMTSDGNEGWYQYDSVEGTYQRYHEVVRTVEEADTSVTENGDAELAYKYQCLSQDYLKLKKYAILGAGAAIILILILLISLIVTANKKKKEDDYEIDVEDFEEEDIEDDDIEEEDAEVEDIEAEDIEEEDVEVENAAKEDVAIEAIDEETLEEDSTIISEKTTVEDTTVEDTAVEDTANEEATEVPDFESLIISATESKEEVEEEVKEEPKEKFSTIDLSKLALQLEAELQKQTEAMAPETEAEEPAETEEPAEKKETRVKLESVSSDSDDDDFEFIDL